MGNYIYYTISENAIAALKGTDDLGNEVVFTQAGGAFEEESKFELAAGYAIDETATSLTLEVYEAIEGETVATGQVVTVLLP